MSKWGFLDAEAARCGCQISVFVGRAGATVAVSKEFTFNGRVYISRRVKYVDLLDVMSEQKITEQEITEFVESVAADSKALFADCSSNYSNDTLSALS